MDCNQWFPLANPCVDGRNGWSCQDAGCDVVCSRQLPLDAATPCVVGRNGWPCQDAGCDLVCSRQLPLDAATPCVDGRNGGSCQDAGRFLVCSRQLSLATPCVDGRNGWSCQDAGCDLVCSRQLPLATLCVDGRIGWSCQDAGCDLVCSRQLPDGRIGWSCQDAGCDLVCSRKLPLATPRVDGRNGWSCQQAGRDVVSAWMMAVSSADKICPLFLNIVWNEYGLNGSVWSESFVYCLDSFFTLEGSESSLCVFSLLLGICLMFTCWLGMCCKPSARPGNKKRKRLKRRRTLGKKGKQMSDVVGPGGPDGHECVIAFAGRKVGQQRVEKARLKHRHRHGAQVLRVRYLKAWLSGRALGFRKKALGKLAQTRTVACQSLGLVRRLDPNRVGGVDLSLADDSVSQFPRSFRGGAAGAAKTSRKRQESLLLNGLRDLLLQVGQGEKEEVSEQPSLHRRPSPARGRGRGCERDRSPQRSRSPSPGWIVKGKGKRIGKPTDSIKPPVAFDSTKLGGKKGKGGSVATAEKRVQFLEKPQSQVGGGATLLAQLKALVLEADMHGCHDLVPRLSGLVQTFTKEPEERAPPKAPAEPRPRSQRQADHKIDKAWWPQGLVPFKKVCEALDAGEE